MYKIDELFNFLKKSNIEKEEKILDNVNRNKEKYSSYTEFNGEINKLLNLFVQDDEIIYQIENEYNEEKNGYNFNIKNIYANNSFDVFITISDNNIVYSNILRKSYDNRIQAKKYFDELRVIIRNNNVNDLSEIILNMLR